MHNDAVEVFFNRPQRPFPKERLLTDIRQARHGLAVASAWFTDNDIAQAVIDAPAPFGNKLVFLNQSDLQRTGHRAVQRLESYFAKAIRAFEQRQKVKTPNPHRYYHRTNIVILGSTNFQEGVMHHKFVVADKVCWTGSYNYTYQAASNYETVLRFTKPDVVKRFWAEARVLERESDLWDSSKLREQHSGDGTFRCLMCKKLYPATESGFEDTLGVDYCNKCHPLNEEMEIGV